ncbi:hypothetical protein F5Y06DRAFT_303485 [Hypoxylon sp. FL0890]|nr:hypothetical protein F5Y06DRAFT_303485 [Hypoxylon sp. FL0890]
MMDPKELTGGHLIAGEKPRPEPDYLEEIRGQQYPITYGVELQFLVPVLARGQSDPHPDETREAIIVEPGFSYAQISRRVTDAVLDRLRGTAQVPAWTHLGPMIPNRATMAKMDSESQAVSYMPAYSQWVVQTDEDLLPKDDPFSEIYTWVGVKVKSSKRNTSWPNHFDQIGRVLVALRADLRMRLAPTTSLSIHVGVLWHDIMSYEMGPRFLRVFCTMWWLLERHVQDLAHPSRRTHPACQPLRSGSRLARMDPSDLQYELEEGGMDKLSFRNWHRQMHFIVPTIALNTAEMNQIESIWRAKDGKSIVQKMTVQTMQTETMELTGQKSKFPCEGRGSVGFQGFCEGAIGIPLAHNDGYTGTIEFRSMESSLDPLLILNWIAVVVRLFDFSRRGNTGDIMGILARAQTEDGSFNGLNLLQDLGIDQQYVYFADKMEADKTRDITQESLPTLLVPPADEYIQEEANDESMKEEANEEFIKEEPNDEFTKEEATEYIKEEPAD